MLNFSLQQSFNSIIMKLKNLIFLCILFCTSSILGVLGFNWQVLPHFSVEIMKEAKIEWAGPPGA